MFFGHAQFRAGVTTATTIRRSASCRPAEKIKRLALTGCLLVAAGCAWATPAGDFPRIGLMFATSNGGLVTPQQVARYDVVVDAGLLSSLGDANMALVRQANPNFIGLMAQAAGYVNQASPLLADPGFSEQYLVHYAPAKAASVPPCDPSLRATFYSSATPGPIIYYWNLTTAAGFIANFEIQQYQQLKSLHPVRYDGIYFDGSNLTPQFYNGNSGTAFDLDCNGLAETAAQHTQIANSWQGYVAQFLQTVRNGLPGIAILANGIQTTATAGVLAQFSPILNGISDELDISDFLDNLYNTNWQNSLFQPLVAWNSASLSPPLTMAFSLASSTALFNPTQAQIVQASQQNLARMRFGLATALVTGSHFLYDLSSVYTGSSSFWYDEYDNAGTQAPGYLGAPIGPAYLLDNTLTTPNLLANPGFDSAANGKGCTATTRTGLASWCTTDTKGLSQIVQDCSTAYGGGCSARITTATASASPFQLEQDGAAIVAGQAYTLSFWAKAAQPVSAKAYLMGEGSVNYALLTGTVSAQLTGNWQYFTYTLNANAITPATPSQIRFVIEYGTTPSTIWIDGISLQQGVVGVYGRLFGNGMVLVNTTSVNKTINLNGVYHHIRGTQDPVVNNGQTVGSVTVAGKDGVILLNSPTP